MPGGNMKECVVCNTKIADDAYVCPKCGGGTFSFSGDEIDGYDTALEFLHSQDKSSQHVDRSVKYANAGDFEKAIAEIKIALKMCPNNPTAHGNMGGFLLAQGKARAAIPWLQKALELNPNIEGLPEALAMAKADKKEINKKVILIIVSAIVGISIMLIILYCVSLK